MKIRAVRFILLLFCLEASSATRGAEFLHTQGEDIVGESGNPVLLKGVGLGNWMLPEGYMWRFGPQGDRPRKIEKLVSDLIGPDAAASFWTEYRKEYVTEADIRRIAELGFNSVRPALNARLFLTEGENPVYVDEGFQLLDNLVGWCRRHNIYVIIDMHGAPGGQTGANIDDSARDLPELFTEPKHQDRLVELWVKIASRYKDEPAVAAYDLLNEPLPKRTGAFEKHHSQLEPLYKRITQAIRAVDKKHMITLEGGDWANEWSVFSAPFDDNLVYQFHYYCWDRPTHLNDIRQYLGLRKKLKAPVWVGETGEANDAIYWGTTEYFEANNIGWSFWPWKKMEARNGPCSIKPPPGWDEIKAYSEGKARPSKESAQRSFDQLLKNIRLENCNQSPEVVNALFHRAPGMVQAENYGHEGAGKSYLVKNPAAKSKYYRTSEPVTVELLEGGPRGGGSGQAIKLLPGEWTVYTINSLAARDCAGEVKVKGEAPGAFQISVEGNVQEIAVTNKDWANLKLPPMHFAKGANHLKLAVKSGKVSFDWIKLE